jgi:hypothetical protein
MKRHVELDEGQQAFERFREAVKAVIAVPKNALPPKPHRDKKKTAKPKA